MSSTTSNQTSLMSLYQVGAHRGNKKAKLNPRLKSRIYGYKQGMSLIDLAKTKTGMEKVEEFLYTLGTKKKQILIVGTSKHLKHLVPDFANSFLGGPMPYVDSRWLGGTITNWPTVRRTLKTLEKLTKIQENKEFFNNLSKNEQLNISRKYTKISRFFMGLVYLKSNHPGCVVVINAQDDPIAIEEADLSNVPVVTLANTSSIPLPQNLDLTIVTNTHSIKAVEFMIARMTESYNRGFNSASVVDSRENNDSTLDFETV